MAKSLKPVELRFSRIDFFRLREYDFYQALFRAIERQLGGGKVFDQRWAKLSPLQQGVYAWWVFWGDVENGGLVQYFYNQGDKGVPGLAALLKATDNARLADILKKAHAIYRKRRAEFSTDKVWGQDGLFGRMTEFNKLDESISGLIDAAGKRIEKWLRANPAKIFVGDDGQPIDPQFSREIETRHPNGKVFEQATLRRGTMTGAYRRFHPDGTLDHAEFYEGGKISGDYWPNGQIKKQKTKQGDWTIHEWFYPSGRLQKRYVRGKSGYPIEPIRMWHENGQLSEELHVKNGKSLGPWLKFFEDGQPRLEARHEKGEKLVVENAWDEKRKQIVKNGTGTYVGDGMGIKWEYDLYFVNNWIRSLPFRRGVLQGQGCTWHDGVLWSEEHYKNGQRDGEVIGYYDNGRVRSKATYRAGKEIDVKRFPKFDNPRPAVLIEVESNARLYAGWKRPPPDVYPQPKNVARLQASLKAPKFLQQVFERNLAHTVTEDYEDINRFNDGTTHFINVNERGEVTRVEFSGCSAYSIAVAEDYPPILKQLRFTPAKLRGKKVPGWAIARVEHTFAEAQSK